MSTREIIIAAGVVVTRADPSLDLIQLSTALLKTQLATAAKAESLVAVVMRMIVGAIARWRCRRKNVEAGHGTMDDAGRARNTATKSCRNLVANPEKYYVKYCTKEGKKHGRS